MRPDDRLQEFMGTIFLVGAGPGDPELLTLKAKNLISKADVIAYDDLVHPDILKFAKASAELIPVGYRGRRNKSAEPQQETSLIHRDLVTAAREGKIALRLKSGDPMVFGRAVEEAQEIARHGLKFHIVPGITAALGAAASLALPLTHRDLAHGFKIITGHIAGARPPEYRLNQDETLVMYMPRQGIGEMVKQLTAAGVSPDVPAAFVVAATTPCEQFTLGTLQNIEFLAQSSQADQPGMVVVGPTVHLCRDLAPFHNRDLLRQDLLRQDLLRRELLRQDLLRRDLLPQDIRPGDLGFTKESLNKDSLKLAGKRILISKTQTRRSTLSLRLRQLGADVIETPLISGSLTKNIELFRIFKDLIEDFCQSPDRWQGIVFLYAFDVKFFVRALRKLDFDLRNLPLKPIFCGDLETLKMVRRHGLTGRLLPTSPPQGPRHLWLLPCSTQAGANPRLPAGWRDLKRNPKHNPKNDLKHDTHGTIVPAPMYSLQYRLQRITAPYPDLIITANCKSVDLLFAETDSLPLLGFDPRQIPVLTYGPATSAQAQKYGAKHILQAQNANLDAVVAEASTFLSNSVHPNITPAINSQQMPASYPKDHKPQISGQILVYTGPGKGKTTAALGLMYRALGYDLKVGVVQFIKGKWTTGERRNAARYPAIDFFVMGLGFTWDSDDLSRDQNAAWKAWQKAAEMINHGEHDVVILDELTYVMNYGFVDTSTILLTLAQRPAHVSVVITGRNAPSSLIEIADLVTEMGQIKHPFTKGLKAQKGLDF